jgi:creatinine amidohydrolase
MRVADLPWPEAGSKLEQGTPVVLPLGAIEQHGPHLPLHTDSTCVQALADAVAAETGAMSLPALDYGAPSRPRTGGGPRFPLGAEIPLGIYYQTVRGITESLLTHGVQNLLLLSWHLENSAVMYDAAREAMSVARADGARIALVDSPMDLLDPGVAGGIFGGDLMNPTFEHAGLVETAVMLSLEPEAVRPYGEVESALPAAAYDLIPEAEDMVPSSGSFTSPAKATAEAGGRLVDAMTRATAAVIASHLGHSSSSSS